MSNNILHYRVVKNGWTRRTLADKSGITESQLYKLEHGAAKPTLDTAMKLSKAFNVDIKELFEEEE